MRADALAATKSGCHLGPTPTSRDHESRSIPQQKKKTTLSITAAAVIIVRRNRGHLMRTRTAGAC